MAWIKTPEPEASGELHEAYERTRAARGYVANILRVSGVNPRVMRAHLDFYVAVMFGSSDLSRADRELLATVVSATNGCHY